MRVWIFCILSAWILGACNSNRKFSGSLLKATLQQADGNTGELIAVLEHYEDDPQKREAAEFLITNMLDQVVWIRLPYRMPSPIMIFNRVCREKREV